MEISRSTWRPGNPGRAARIAGTLRTDSKGCPYLDPGGGERLWVVWPAGFTASSDDLGQFVVVGPNGDVIAREGDFLETGGARAGGRAIDMPCIPEGVVISYIESEISVTPGEP